MPWLQLRQSAEAVEIRMYMSTMGGPNPMPQPIITISSSARGTLFMALKITDQITLSQNYN